MQKNVDLENTVGGNMASNTLRANLKRKWSVRNSEHYNVENQYKVQR